MACAASFPLGSIIPCNASYIVSTSPVSNYAVVPVKQEALFITFISQVLIFISYFFAKYKHVMQVIIFVREAIYRFLSA